MMMSDHRQFSSHKRRRRDSDQDNLTFTPGTALMPQGRHESSSARPDAILDSRFSHAPASHNIVSPPDHGPNPTEFSHISEWITQLSHDDVQQLLADAAARHQDVFTALQVKSQQVELTRQKDKSRIEEHLMSTYDLCSTSTRAPAAEESVFLEEPDGEGEEEELKFGLYASEAQYILDEKWAHRKLSSQLRKTGHATNDIMAMIDNGIINKLGHDSNYSMKATALLDIFAVAEALTYSSTELAEHVRKEITHRGFYDKVLGMVRRLDPMERIRFLQNEVCVDYLSDIFSESVTSQSSSMIIAQMKAIISDHHWAKDQMMWRSPSCRDVLEQGLQV